MFNIKRTAWVRAVTFCHLSKLTRQAFEDLLSEFPESSEQLYEKIGDFVSKRYSEANQIEGSIPVSSLGMSNSNKLAGNSSGAARVTIVSETETSESTAVPVEGGVPGGNSNLKGNEIAQSLSLAGDATTVTGGIQAEPDGEFNTPTLLNEKDIGADLNTLSSSRRQSVSSRRQSLNGPGIRDDYGLTATVGGAHQSPFNNSTNFLNQFQIGPDTVHTSNLLVEAVSRVEEKNSKMESQIGEMAEMLRESLSLRSMREDAVLKED